MRVVAEKWNDGKFRLHLEIPAVDIPVVYTEEDIKTLESNGVLLDRESYNSGNLLKFAFTREEEERVVNAILDAVTERRTK